MASRWLAFPRQALRVVTLAVPIVLAFGATVLPLAWILAWCNGTPLEDAGNVTLACTCGLIASLFLIVFHAKPEAVVVPFKDRLTFLANCRHVLQDLGYDVDDKPGGELVSRPTFRALLFGGRIHVRTGDGGATVSGPKLFVELVRRRVRVACHIANVEQSLRDGRQRAGDRMLKRVQISLRVAPAQWEEVGRGLVQSLAAEGAEVLCEIHLMAHSEAGIREAFVEGPLRDWLKLAHLQADVHKDHARWDEPSRPGLPLEIDPADVETVDLHGTKV